MAEVLHLDGGVDSDPDRDFEALARGCFLFEWAGIFLDSAGTVGT